MGGLKQAIEEQAHWCAVLGSPFGAAFMQRVAADLETGGPVGALLAPWGEVEHLRVVADAAPLRLLAAFHDLALDGMEPALAAAYPAAAGVTDWNALWPLVERLANERRERLAAFMGHEPQTNEVRRSICLLGGFLTVAAETGLPLRCLELGASAGLNLKWDSFGYRLGEATWGDPAATVRIETDWRGGPPPLGPVQVSERAGCDRRPSRLDDPAQRRRLKAYIWADQTDRLQRLDAAMRVAQAAGTMVDAADAADWLEPRLALTSGVATVVYHSVVWQYLPAATQDRLRAMLERAGEAASAGAPLAWLRMEPPRGVPDAPMEVSLTLWPHGETRVLARVHPHGATVHWLV